MGSRDGSVGTATTLRAGRSGDRILVGARFSAPVQTGPGAYPASYIMSTGSLPGVKRPGRGVDHHPPPSSVEVKGTVELYICSPSGPSLPVLGRTLLHVNDISSHYGIFICQVDGRKRSKQVARVLRTTCLYVTVCNYSPVVGVYTVMFFLRILPFSSLTYV